MAEIPITDNSSSASRQKSCHACVKGKRGCDKQQPTCSRCVEKKLQCIYIKRTYSDAFSNYNMGDLDMSWPDYATFSTPINSSSPISPNVNSSGPLGPANLSNLDVFMEPFMDFSNNRVVISNDMQLINLTGGSSSSLWEKEQTLTKFDYSPMADLCKQYQPWHVYDPNTKVHFIVQALKRYPTTFAEENGTSWMHKHLYKDKMPSSIQACFTASTLYSNMTTSNKILVFRVLCQSLEELKRVRSDSTPQEQLARVQSLFLYQIIGLFDGDVSLRSNADRNMLLLQDWLDELCKIRENLTTSESMNNLKPPTSWEWWIFSESVRRTVILAYAFLGMWSVMSDHGDARVFSSWEYLHRWTMCRSSWEASSSFDFFQSWRAYHVIENFDLENFLKTGKPDDVDNFSKVFMVAYMGLDNVKQWFRDHGGVFQQE